MTLGREDLLKSHPKRRQYQPKPHSTPDGYISKSKRPHQMTICIYNQDGTREYCFCDANQLFAVLEGKQAYVTFYSCLWRKD